MDPGAQSWKVAPSLCGCATNDIVAKITAGTVVSEAERAKAKATSIVDLNPGDLGPILFGKLPKDGYSSSNTPIVTAFTKDNISEAHRKLGFDIFT